MRKRTFSYTAALFGAFVLTGLQWGGTYAGAALVDGVLSVALALLRCVLAAALCLRAVDPARLNALGLRALWPLTLLFLLTHECIGTLGSLLPLAAEIFAGTAWLEAVYPHGQLLWTAFALLGTVGMLLAAGARMKKRGVKTAPGTTAALLWRTALWAALTWGARAGADALGIADSCFIALVTDFLSAAGPAWLLAVLITRAEPVSPATPTRWDRPLSILWAPALRFFAGYGFTLRMLEALADYGMSRPMAWLPLDALGDLAVIAALWAYAAAFAARTAGRSLTGKDFLHCWPAAAGGTLMLLVHSLCLFPLEEAMAAAEYHVARALGWVGLSLLTQTLALALPAAAACGLTHAGRNPLGRLLLWSVLLSAADLFLLLVSWGFAAPPGGYTFGLMLALQMPFTGFIAARWTALAGLAKPKAAGGRGA